MSYQLAQNCFKENIGLTGGAQTDPVSFNLYNGLFQLTRQLSSDIRELKQESDRLKREVDQLQGMVRHLR